MKTNAIMSRDKFKEIQRTKDGYFNANIMLDNWNKANPSNKRNLDFYKRQKSVKEYITYLKEKEGINKPIIISRGRNSSTWMHPLLMIDFAVYVSVEFKTLVYKWTLDGLIFNRNKAGDYYNEMCATILDTYVLIYNRKPPPMIYINEANLIKSLVTNKARNKMTEQELKQITYLQKVNANLIKKRIGKVARLKRLRDASEIII